MRQGVQRRVEHLEETTGARYTAENPRERFRIVKSGSWTPVPGAPGQWSLGDLDLSKSICRRTLHADGFLWEWVEICGNWEKLSAEDLERWIAAQPVKRVVPGQHGQDSV